MARNLVNIGRHHTQIGSELAALRSTIELFLAIQPGDIEHWLLLARLYLYLDINLIEVSTRPLKHDGYHINEVH
jgi:hypothetical protein